MSSCLRSRLVPVIPSARLSSPTRPHPGLLSYRGLGAGEPAFADSGLVLGLVTEPMEEPQLGRAFAQVRVS